MRVKLHSLDKYRENPEAFEAKVNAWIKTVGDVVLTKVDENAHTSDIIFSFEYGDKKSVEQELCVIAWGTVSTLENNLNAVLEALDENNQRARYINFVTTSKSARSLVAFVVESSGSGTSDAVGPEDYEEGSQDPGLDVKPKQRRQRKIRAEN